MYHFIGIKGSGMSALAIIMKQLGFEVQGSDYEKHFFTETGLKENNIITLPFNKTNIKENMIIIKGNTFNDENEEVKEAIKKGLPIYTYQEQVKNITEKYNLIAVSGCHGKTTTASMLAHTLDSNYLIGDGSGGVKDSSHFILEACEYKRHFLNYHPKTVIITNIDLDHVDYYKNIEEVKEAYNEFIKKTDKVIACGDDKNIKKLSHQNIYFYGIGDNTFQAKNTKYTETGIEFDLYIDKQYKYHFKLPFYGKHMLINSLAVISTCYLEGKSLEQISKKLQTFIGAKRRFKETKVLDNIIIDDYAHHPNEIESVINAAKQKYPNKKIIAVFEPHTYSRTQQFSKEIANKLNKCNYSYVMDIYPSREKQEDFKNITSNMIIQRLKKGSYLKKENIKELLDYHNSVLIFMSPNDLTDMENEYKKQYLKTNNQ